MTSSSSTQSALARLTRDDAAWDAFVGTTAAPTHLQTTPWARAKASNGWATIRVVADGGSGPIGAQILVRRLGPGPFAIGYAPRGPVATVYDAQSLAAFSDAVRRAAKRHRLTHVTLEPGIEERHATLLDEAGWRFADPVQGDRTVVVDLEKTEAELWAGLRSGTRRYVKRAQKDGCTVYEGEAADFDTFHSILIATATRGGFVHRSKESYRAVYEAFAPVGGARLIFARLPDGTPAATKMLVGCCGITTQPYSGMTPDGAAARANYLLEWETIKRANEWGLRTYDMWGLSTTGIAQFKGGFGGREVRYVGSWDLVTLPLVREGIVRARRGYVWLARKRRGLPPPPPPATIGGSETDDSTAAAEG